MKHLFALAVSALALLGAFAADKDDSAASEPQRKQPPPTVLVEQAHEVASTRARRYVGKLKALYDINLVARISGNIIEQKVAHGDYVDVGQLIFVLEDTTYRAAVDSARAKVKLYEAEARYASSNLERNTTLIGQKAVAESSYEEAVRLHSVAEANLAAAQAELLDAENNLSYTRVYSPIKGRMGKATYSPGNYVTPASDKLATVITIDPVNVDFAISERDYLSIFGSIEAMKKFADVRLILADDSEYPGRGRIVFVDNKVDTGTDTITVRAEFDNPDYRLQPGGLATVLLSRELDRKPVAVRSSAVIFDRNGSFVYVIDANNVAARREVQTGELVGDMQIISSGLNPGETVVIDGTHKVRPGEAVMPLRSQDRTEQDTTTAAASGEK